MSLIYLPTKISRIPRITLRSIRHQSSHAGPSPRAKQHSQRGGQNLSERYIRLEKSLRGKEALETNYEDLTRSTLTGPSATSLSQTTNIHKFRGLAIPEQPKEPQSDECCMSGCAVCVYDLYEDSLTAYRDAVAKVKATLNSMGVPESEWLRSLHLDDAAGVERQKDVTLSVFEQMELDLQRRKQEKSAGDPAALAEPQTSTGKGVEVER